LQTAQTTVASIVTAKRISRRTLFQLNISFRAPEAADHLDNLALACQGCNNRKYSDIDAIDPVSGERVPLFHPRQHQWKDHFAWNDDFTMVIGLTPTGRATIEKLWLNRDGVVNLRHALRSIGAHPPIVSGE